MKTLNLGKMVILFLLMSLLGISSESCKKTNTIPDPALLEDATSRPPGLPNALPHTKQYPADVAVAWFNLLTDISRSKPYTATPSLRIFAYSGMALYESVVPGMPSYQSIYTYFTGSSIDFDKKKDYYWPACANAAVARIASRIIEDNPSPNLTQVQALEQSLNASFQANATPEQLKRSNEFGKHVADVIYEWSKTDGTLTTLANCPDYVPLGGPGNWVPTPPLLLKAVGQCQGELRSFIPNVANMLMPPPHPAYSTSPASDYFQAANEIYNTSLTLTPDNRRLINNWRDIIGTNYNQASHTLRIFTAIIKKENLNLEDASVLFAKQTIAASDAIVAASKAKYQYSLQRPITYIRNVMGFSGWISAYNTPQLPSYPSFQGLQASSLTILENYFGTNYALTDSVHKSLYGSFSYSSIKGLLEDIKRSNLMSGTEFRFGIEAGIKQGQAVGQLVYALPFKKP